ncbi:hypothetical protein N7493_005664 [Penicillium malachiteum]|uniref:Glycosyltransferase family 28 N-terminal domain-containing protein n=1 Tax=Penicillium malachiteum TaxID=1324776 RepID=A0AAD6MWR9_9EURO|nr:hypothetical protein N7493_005664 [Penicillium malachiteum]
MDIKYRFEDMEVDPSTARDENSDEDVLFEDSPPAYNSIFTNEQLQLPEYTSERPQSIILRDTGCFSIDLSVGNRTSAFIQSFSLPVQRPRIIEINTSTSTASEGRPVHASGDLDPDTKGIALDIVLMLIGSRDEIKSMILVGQELQKQGSRVLVVTHSIFQSFATKLGMEFFSISNDPQHSIAKNDSGFIPGLSSFDRVQVQQSRRTLLHTLKKCWNACNYSGLREGKPFSADAIIATPLVHAHIHCAERLSIPLHIMSTTPWTPTRQFAHPLAQIETGSEIDYQIQNYLSYILVEDSIQNEVHLVIDYFRQAILGLTTPRCVEEKGLLAQFGIPHTYLWSSRLLARPGDWEDQIDIAGYVPVKSSQPNSPSEKLQIFVHQAVDPILILADPTQLKDPERFVESLKEASLKYGVFVILPEGFRELDNLPDLPTIFILDSKPTEWLISRVAVLLTSGSAPSINLGIRYAKPMICVPLLQDQPFWATAVHNAGIGPAPIQEEDFASETFIKSFSHCLSPDVREATIGMNTAAEQENGAANAANSFYRNLQWEKVRRSSITSEPAIYSMRLKGVMPTTGEMVKLENRMGKLSTRGGGASNDIEAEMIVSVQKAKPSFLMDTKNVGQSLVKAIIKPTVSHISDARSKKEAQNDVPARPTNSNPEKSKSDVALKMAKSVGFGSAVACGKIAILPFKTVYYMSETASYGIRALQNGPKNGSRDQGREAVDHYSQTIMREPIEGPNADLDLFLQQDDAYSRAVMASNSNT